MTATARALIGLYLAALLAVACVSTHHNADGSSETSFLGIPITSKDPTGRTTPTWMYAVGGLLAGGPAAGLVSGRGWANWGKLLTGLVGTVSGGNGGRGSSLAQTARAVGALYGLAHTEKPEPKMETVDAA